MNVINIFKLDQLETIISDRLCLSGVQSEEIHHNMWCISLDSDFIGKITLKQLRYFVDRLIENREQQLKDINVHGNVVFYMWFDQQALQLRFNIITGDVYSLPFRCKIRVNNAYKIVLDNFINTVRDVAQNGDKIEFCNNEDWEDEDNNNEEEYILDVFVKILRLT